MNVSPGNWRKTWTANFAARAVSKSTRAQGTAPSSAILDAYCFVSNGSCLPGFKTRTRVTSPYGWKTAKIQYFRSIWHRHPILLIIIFVIFVLCILGFSEVETKSEVGINSNLQNYSHFKQLFEHKEVASFQVQYLNVNHLNSRNTSLVETRKVGGGFQPLRSTISI